LAAKRERKEQDVIQGNTRVGINFQQLLAMQPELIEQVRRVAEARLDSGPVEGDDPLKS